MSRRISRMTLELVRDMAADPRSTPAMRAFHSKQLEELQRRYDAQNKPPRTSPFSRFEQYLNDENYSNHAL